jgi:ribosomal protein S18 acetylase RimI-like enzyme
METRYGQEGDIDWLIAHDPHVRPEWIRRCILQREYVLACNGAARIGYLRFSMFWGNIPYMDLIWVVQSHRRQGAGTAMFRFWEQDMRRCGAKLLMTSSMDNEPEPQAWHQRNGFRQSGSLTFGKVEQTPEVFFVLDLV